MNYSVIYNFWTMVNFFLRLLVEKANTVNSHLFSLDAIFLPSLDDSFLWFWQYWPNFNFDVISQNYFNLLVCWLDFTEKQGLIFLVAQKSLKNILIIVSLKESFRIITNILLILLIFRLFFSFRLGRRGRRGWWWSWRSW